jgi:hypothetical protein
MHESDPLWESIRLQAPTEIHVVDVRRGPSAVIKEIAACEHILSTSLHGLIAADSFDIPAAWARREPDLWGGRFKFLDYESAVTPGTTRETMLEGAVPTPAEVVSRTSRADGQHVQRLQQGLLESLHALQPPLSMPLLAVRRAFGT